jgi:hypothetical protein
MDKKFLKASWSQDQSGAHKQMGLGQGGTS